MRLTLACAVWAGLAFVAGSQAFETNRAFGEASYQFLKLPLSPRVTALSGAGAALWNGGGEAESNPASVARDDSRVIAGYGMPFGQFGARASHVAWNTRWNESPESGRLWFGARYLGFDEIMGRSEIDEATTPYGAHTWKGQIGYAKAWQALNIGLALGFAQNHIAEATYSTGLLNLGAQYRVWRGLSLGGMVTNLDFGADAAQQEGYDAPFAPTVFQAGLAYTQDLPRNLHASLAFDARTRNDETMVFPAGLELAWKNAVTVRMGYPFGAAEEQQAGLTAGVGLAWSMFRVNYAIESHETLEAGHYLSLEIAY